MKSLIIFDLIRYITVFGIVLLFHIFAKDNLGKPDKRLMIAYFLAFPACIILSETIGFVFGSIFSYIVFALYYMFAFKQRSIWYRLFLFIAALITAMAGDQIVETTYVFFSHKSLSLNNISKIAYASGAICELIIVFLLHKVLTFILKKFPFKKISPVFIFVSASQFIVIYAIVATAMRYDIVHKNKWYLIFYFIAIICSLASNFVVIKMSNSIKDKEILEQKLLFLEDYDALSQNYQDKVNSHLTEIRKIKHDFNNSIQVIRSLIDKNDMENASALAQELQNTYISQPSISFCQNTILNVILQQSQQECQENNIDFHVKCNLAENLPMSKLDICSLFNNLLRNAQCAVMKISENDNSLRREIFFEAWRDHNMIFVQVRNPNISDTNFQNGRFVTTKNDRENHGYGLEIVRHIAEKYDGYMKASLENNTFSVLIQLNVS